MHLSRLARAASCSLAVVFLFALILTTGCQTHRHYRAYLLEPTSTIGNKYRPAVNNVIKIPKNTRVTLRVDDIKLGWVHDELDGANPLKRAYEGLGGKDLWLVVDGVSLDNTDPLGLREKRFSASSNIKADQESYSFLTLDSSEQIVFDQIIESSYFLQFRIYRVDYLTFKKKLYQTTHKSLARLTFDAFEMAAKQTANLVAEEIFDYLRQSASEPLFVEKVLLASGATIVFHGNLELQMAEAVEGATTFNIPYALYDMGASQKDEDFRRRPDGPSDYKTTVDKIQRLEIKLPQRTGRPLAQDDIASSFILFSIKPPSLQEQIQTIYQFDSASDSDSQIESLQSKMDARKAYAEDDFEKALNLDPENVMYLTDFVAAKAEAMEWDAITKQLGKRQGDYLSLTTLAYAIVAYEQTKHPREAEELTRELLNRVTRTVGTLSFQLESQELLQILNKYVNSMTTDRVKQQIQSILTILKK